LKLTDVIVTFQALSRGMLARRYAVGALFSGQITLDYTFEKATSL